MASIYLEYSSGGSTSGTFDETAEVWIEYTAKNGSFTLTDIQAIRTDGYHSYNIGDTSVSVNVGGSTKTVSLSHYVDFNSSWTSFEPEDKSWSGLTGTSISVAITMPSGSQAYSNAKFTGTATMNWDTYTISYNDNVSSTTITVPSNQTKTYGTDLTLSSTKPTRTGYTFECWNTKSDGSGTNYNAGAKYTSNSAATLYAIWTEHILTVNYYSNYADYCTLEGSSVSVSSSSNVKVATSTFYYDNSCSGGLADVQNTDYLYLKRTGYTPTGKWGTSASGGTLLDQKTSFDTGQALAQALGKDISSGNASINIYAQWTENVLTVNMYSNYATSVFDDALNEVSADSNVHVKTQTFYYDNTYSNGLANYSNSTGAAYMTRIGHTATGYWNTSADGSGTSVNENTEFATGQDYAEAFGLSLKDGDASVTVYAQWRENILTANYYSNYATSAFDGAVNEVGADKNVIVRTHTWTYNSDALSDGLHNYSAEDATTYLARTRYDAVGYWGTATEVYTKDDEGDEDGIISNENGIAVFEDNAFSSGQELAEAFGLTLEDGDKEINLYAQWILRASMVTIYLPDENGNIVPQRGLVHIYDDNKNVHYGIVTVYTDEYDENGSNAHVVI